MVQPHDLSLHNRPRKDPIAKTKRRLFRQVMSAFLAISVVSLTLPPSVSMSSSEQHVPKPPSSADFSIEKYSKLIPPEKKAEAESLAIRYVVRLIELALPGIESPDEFISIFFENASPDDREFLRKKLKYIPQVERLNPTTLVIVDGDLRVALDFREILKGRTYVNGQPIVIKDTMNLRKEWPYWERKFEHILQLQRQERQDKSASLFHLFLERLLPQVEAQQNKAMRMSETLELLAARAAERAAGEAAKQAAREASGETAKAVAEILAKKWSNNPDSSIIGFLTQQINDQKSQIAELAAKVERQSVATTAKPGLLGRAMSRVPVVVIGTASAVGAAVATTAGQLSGSILKSYLCDLLKQDDPECVTARVAKQTAEQLTSGPELTGGNEETAKNLAKLFELKEITCRKKIPEDPVKFTIRFKYGNVKDDYAHVEVTYDKDGRITGGSIADRLKPELKSITYTFASGRLTKVCTLLTEEDVESRRRQSVAPIIVPSGNCITHDTKGKETEFDQYSLLTQFVDSKQRSECAEKRAAIVETKNPGPTLPKTIPVVPSQADGVAPDQPDDDKKAQ